MGKGGRVEVKVEKKSEEESLANVKKSESTQGLEALSESKSGSKSRSGSKSNLGASGHQTLEHFHALTYLLPSNLNPKPKTQNAKPKTQNPI